MNGILLLDDGYVDAAVNELKNGHTATGPLRGGRYSISKQVKERHIINWPGH